MPGMKGLRKGMARWWLASREHIPSNRSASLTLRGRKEGTENGDDRGGRQKRKEKSGEVRGREEPGNKSAASERGRRAQPTTVRT